ALDAGAIGWRWQYERDRIFTLKTTRKCGGRPRATPGETARAIRAAVEELTNRLERMTVRQLYYQLETAGDVGKSEAAGYRPVQDQVLKVRREGLLDWGFVADGTRWRKPDSYDNATDYIDQVARNYRRDLWQSQ